MTKNIDNYDALFGYVITPGYYCSLKYKKPTRKEKIMGLIWSSVDIIQEMGIVIGICIGIGMQVAGLAYIAGIFFKKGFL